MPLEAEVAFQELSFEKEAESIQTKYKNVSGGGLLVTSKTECPIGTLIKLEIRVPGFVNFASRASSPTQPFEQKALVAVGQVVRLELMDDGEYELGVKFLNVYPDDLNALLALINSSDQAQ
jgi:hypothetical protein